MYSRILIPTDGSPLARKGIRAGLALARALKAQVIGVHVGRRFARTDPPEFGTAASVEKAKAAGEKAAARALASFEKAAKSNGVKCTTQIVHGDTAWKAILEVAMAQKCDLIVIASHGGGAMRALLVGSETASLLSHSTVPLLVIR